MKSWSLLFAFVAVLCVRCHAYPCRDSKTWWLDFLMKSLLEKSHHLQNRPCMTRATTLHIQVIDYLNFLCLNPMQPTPTLAYPKPRCHYRSSVSSGSTERSSLVNSLPLMESLESRPVMSLAEKHVCQWMRFFWALVLFCAERFTNHGLLHSNLLAFKIFCWGFHNHV